MAKTKDDPTLAPRPRSSRRAVRPMAAAAQDLAAELRELTDLHRHGVITAAELASSRARLLWSPRVSRSGGARRA